MFEEKCPNIQKDASIFTCTWNVLSLGARENQEPIKMTATFENGGKKIFSAWLEMTKIPKSRGKLALEALKFFSYGHESICYEIDQIACTFDGQDQDSSTHKMIKTAPYDKNTLQVSKKHILETSLSCPVVLLSSLSTSNFELESPTSSTHPWILLGAISSGLPPSTGR